MAHSRVNGQVSRQLWISGRLYNNNKYIYKLLKVNRNFETICILRARFDAFTDVTLFIDTSYVLADPKTLSENIVKRFHSQMLKTISPLSVIFSQGFLLINYERLNLRRGKPQVVWCISSFSCLRKPRTDIPIPILIKRDYTEL